MAKSKRKKSPFSYLGYEPYKIVKEKTIKKDESKPSFWQRILGKRGSKDIIVKVDYRIHCGPLKENQESIFELLPDAGGIMTPDIKKIVEDKWIPDPQLTVYDTKEKRALTAQEAIERRRTAPRWLPIYYQNPMQSYDYLVYESLFKNTIIGPVMIQLVKFLMGTGFKPELELIHPSGDTKKDKALLEKPEAKKAIDDLMYVDRCISNKTDTSGYDTSFKTKIQFLITNMLVFNRCLLLKTWDEKHPIKIDGKEYPDIATGLIEFHPRDIGLVRINPHDQKMEAVQIQQISGFQDRDDMIYLWNSEFGAVAYIAKYYGASMCTPMIEPARVVRKQLAEVFPAISENMYAGLYNIFVEPQGGTEAQKQQEYLSLTENTQAGTSNLYMISPERVKTEQINYNPKIQDLISMFDAMIKYITATAKLPQIGFYDESAANKATAVEKIQLTKSTTIDPLRDWIGEDIADQWYNPNLRILKAKDEKFLDTYRVKISWDDLQVETLLDRAEALTELSNNGIKLDPEKLEEFLRIEGLAEHMVEPEQPEQIPGMPPKNRFQIKDRKNGDKFNVTEK